MQPCGLLRLTARLFLILSELGATICSPSNRDAGVGLFPARILSPLLLLDSRGREPRFHVPNAWPRPPRNTVCPIPPILPGRSGLREAIQNSTPMTKNTRENRAMRDAEITRGRTQPSGIVGPNKARPPLGPLRGTKSSYLQWVYDYLQMQETR